MFQELRKETSLQALQQRQIPRPFGGRNLPRERRKAMLRVEHNYHYISRRDEIWTVEFHIQTIGGESTRREKGMDH
jgi:hypothetical protein